MRVWHLVFAVLIQCLAFAFFLSGILGSHFHPLNPCNFWWVTQYFPPICSGIRWVEVGCPRAVPQPDVNGIVVLTDYSQSAIRSPWLRRARCTYLSTRKPQGTENLYSPVIIAGAQTIFEMMKPIPVSNNYLPVVHLRDQLRGGVAVHTHPQILRQPNCCTRARLHQAKRDGQFLTVM